MKTGLKRIFFPLKMFFPVFALVIVATLIYGSFYKGSNEVQANVAHFYPANCLGGWKDVDRIAGQPEVRDDNNAVYSEENSASISNSNAQVFCGGFAGELPATAKHQKVTLNFSWYIGDDINPHERVDNKEEPQMEVISETPTVSPQEQVEPSEEILPESEVPTEATPEPEIPKEEPASKPVEEAPAAEAVDEPTALNLFKNFFTIAHAQEEVSEPALVVEEIVTVSEEEVQVPEPESVPEPKPTEEELIPRPQPDLTSPKEPEAVIESNPSEGAYFEVLYTLNGQDWHTLGFISRIANDVQIEMPIDLFATVEDLHKVQIALHTVERFDSVPKIYLDSMWLEVTYDDVDGGELAPPGTRPGDIIFSETIYQDAKAVVVLRNVELMTLSNVLSEATGSTTHPVESTGSSTQSESIAATSTASSTDTQNQSLTDFVGTSTLASIINSTGVLVELWLYASTTDSWSRIADDSIISRNPQVKFESGSVFWVDKNNASVWRYDPKSGGYDALSMSEGQISKLQFRDEAGELRELEFSFGTSSVLLNEIKTPKPLPTI